MTDRKPSRWPLLLAIVAPPLTIGVLGWLTFAPTGDTRPRDVAVGESPTEPPSNASKAEIDKVHAALHSIGAECRTETPDGNRISSDVGSILSFAERFPVGRFSIDDETADGYSLLLVTKFAVKQCAPGELARIDPLLRRLE